MPATERFNRPIDPDAPAFSQELHRVRNPAPAYFTCLCGRCPIGDQASYDDFAIDSCLHTAQRMLSTVAECLLPGDDGGHIALHATRGLLINTRLMLCMRRQASRNASPDPDVASMA
jgi:hypothetical protein